MNVRRIRNYCIILAALLGIAAPSSFNAEIYRSQDASGRVTYSDKSDGNAERVKLPKRTYRHRHRVKKVYDGDTIILDNGLRIRLLGINTPEIEGRFRSGEPGGQAAKEWLTKRIEKKAIYLEYDLEKYDKYQRSLAHVYLPDGTHINLALIENGLAFVNIMPPNLRHAAQFERAQKQAERLKLGIWALPRYQSRPLSKIGTDNKGWRRYTGIPTNIRRKNKYTYLDFNNQTSIRIANENLKYFPDLKHYVGKMVEIRGWVSRSKQKFSMHIRHASALAPL